MVKKYPDKTGHLQQKFEDQTVEDQTGGTLAVTKGLVGQVAGLVRKFPTTL